MSKELTKDVKERSYVISNELDHLEDNEINKIIRDTKLGYYMKLCYQKNREIGRLKAIIEQYENKVLRINEE